MPTYDYRCNHCRHVFEVRRSMNAPEKVEVCPACHATDTARIYAAPNIAGSHQKKGCGTCSSSGCAGCSRN